MSVHLGGSPEPSGYWNQVCDLANDLLVELPLGDWDVTVRPRSAATLPHTGDGRWSYRADHGARQLTVDVPSDLHDGDDAAPEDVATHLVLDLLYGKVCRGENDLPDA